MQEINGYHTDEVDPQTGKPKLLSRLLGLQGRRHDGLRLLDLLRRHARAGRQPRPRPGPNAGQPGEPDWGFAWPHNRRILYNRASADPEGNPWSERKKLICWDEEEKKWDGDDEPDFEPDKAAVLPRPEAVPSGMKAIGGDEPFIMHPDGLAWLFAPGGTKDAPFPTHYEPVESPVRNLLYNATQDNPTTRYFEGAGQPARALPGRRFPGGRLHVPPDRALSERPDVAGSIRG